MYLVQVIAHPVVHFGSHQHELRIMIDERESHQREDVMNR
jgi:hypothetical protein